MLDDAEVQKHWIVIAAMLTAFGGAAGHASGPDQVQTCPGPIIIRGGHPEAKDLICEAVQAARELLKPCGLTQRRPIIVDIVVEMGRAHEACVAYFDCETDRLTALAPNTISASGDVMSALRALSEEEYFRSVIVHEMTHAFVHQSHPDKFPRVAHEYLAFAIQIASLREDDRDKAFKDLRTSEPASLDGIDEIALLFGPSHFALRSSLHFSQPENGCAFVDRIVNADPQLPDAFRQDEAGPQ